MGFFCYYVLFRDLLGEGIRFIGFYIGRFGDLRRLLGEYFDFGFYLEVYY